MDDDGDGAVDDEGHGDGDGGDDDDEDDDDDGDDKDHRDGDGNYDGDGGGVGDADNDDDHGDDDDDDDDDEDDDASAAAEYPPISWFPNVNVSLVSFRWVLAYLRAKSSTSLAADRTEGPWFDPALVKISVVLLSTVWKRQKQNQYTAQQCVQTSWSGLD